MSMSNGELRLDDASATLEVRIPLYEVAGLEDPQQSVLGAFRLLYQEMEVPAQDPACRDADADYVCTARFAFPEPPDAVDVECRLPETTVPNHVHVLRAVRGDYAEQKVFDFTTNQAEIRFRPPSAWDLLRSEAWAGATRVLIGPAQLLFLLALAIAARSRSELAGTGAAFLAAQAVIAAVAASQGWRPPPRFVEAAGALTIAYLAVELLLLPAAGARWLVAGGMGAFHGLYFGVFLLQSKMAAWRVLAGAGAAEAVVLAVLGALAFRLKLDFGERLLTRVSAGVLLAIGLGWFVWRITG